MSKKRPNAWIVKGEDNRLAGAFPLTKEGKADAREYADKLGEKRKEKYKIFKM